MKGILSTAIAVAVTTTLSFAQTKLTTDEFQTKLASSRNGQLVDVRTPEEFKNGHLANAENIDYKNTAFREQIKSLDKNKPVFVYCLGGVRSAAAADILHENGFTEVYDMQGGYMKWTAAGKLIEVPKGASTAKGMSAADFKKMTNTDGVVLVDFHAPWCEPCIRMMPVVKKLAGEYKGKARIETVEYDANKALAKELGIDEIPVFLVYKNGKLVDRRKGFQSESQFREMLDSKL